MNEPRKPSRPDPTRRHDEGAAWWIDVLYGALIVAMLGAAALMFVRGAAMLMAA